jgi:phosphatidylglycerophosphatase A
MTERVDRLKPVDWLSLAWSTWFGSGLLPIMPGTWGTVAALPLLVPMSLFLLPQHYAIAVLALFLVSIPPASRTVRLYHAHPALAKLNPHSRRVFESDELQRFIKDPERQKGDPGMIVVDEVVGYAVAMIAVPPSIATFAIAFILFRFFDIVKIEPGRMLERVGGGLGIILDDVAAGIYACLLTHAFLWLWGAANLPVLP